MKFNHVVAAVLYASAFGAQAQTSPASGADHSAHHAPAAPADAVPSSEGEVRKVDKEQGKVTLKHGPVANLDMPGMTMVFKVADPKMLDAIKEGDKVKFSADRANGAITLTAIQPIK